MKNLIMAHDNVGLQCFKYLVKYYKDTIGMLVTIDDNEIYHLAKQNGIVAKYFDENLYKSLKQEGFDFGFLLWWPHIIRENLIKIPKYGFINTHPSLLPYNKGKHYSFWAIVEQNPFGVSLHFVDSSIDGGDIIAQTAIPYTWEDNGKSLYIKANKETIRLFKQQYKNIISFNFTRTPQLDIGSFHYAKEIQEATKIFLDKSYTARELLNLLRAKTFSPHQGCFFTENNGGGAIDEYFEISISIKKISSKPHNMGRDRTRKGSSSNHSSRENR